MFDKFSWFVFAAVVLVGAGCGFDPAPRDEDLDAVGEFSRLAGRGDWAGADRLTERVLAVRGEDAGMLREVARVKFNRGQFDRALELLRVASELMGHGDEGLVDEVFRLSVAQGRLYEGLAFLSDVMGDARDLETPDRTATRKVLAEMWYGCDRPELADPHARRVVLDRGFDLPWLMLMTADRRREMDEEPLREMVRRRPEDPRPLLGAARRHLDKYEIDAAAKIAKEILAFDPGNAAAAAIAGWAVVVDDRIDDAVRRRRLQSWWDGRQASWMDHGGVWLVVHRWMGAVDRKLSGRALRRAAMLDANDPRIWTEFASWLADSGGADSDGGDSSSRPQRRAELLVRLQQQRAALRGAAGESVEGLLAVSRTLLDLQRRYEAEAWAAVAVATAEEGDQRAGAERQRRRALVSLKGHPPGEIFDPPGWIAGLGRDEERTVLVAAIDRAVNAFAERERDEAGDSSDDAELPERFVVLRDEAAERGLEFFGRTIVGGGDGVLMYQTLGCGGGTIDFDLDGWHDLVMCAAGGTPGEQDSEPSAVFRNLGGRFDRADSAGVSDRGFNQGAVVGDWNEDGLPDVLILNYGCNGWFVNQGDGSFRSVKGMAGQGGADDRWSTSGAVADLNLDGLADAVVANYCDGMQPVTLRCGEDRSAGESTGLEDGSPRHHACSPTAFAAAADQWLMGDGRGGWVDVSSRWSMTPAVPGRGLGVVAGRMTDQSMNVFVVNDMSENHWWSVPVGGGQSGAGQGVEGLESAAAAGLATDRRGFVQGSMGIAVGDLDGNGQTDLFVTNFSDESNTLHRQRGGVFVHGDETDGIASISYRDVGFGTEAIDFDGDGRLELVIANGHVDDFSDVHADSRYAQRLSVIAAGPDRRWRDALMHAESSDGSGYVDRDHIGRALWTIDADRDGRTDVVVTHQDEPAALLMNRTPRRAAVPTGRLEVNLVGTTASRDAIGAVVKVRQGTRMWRQSKIAGGGYLCSNASELVFEGLDPDQVCTVEMDWPGGETSGKKGRVTFAPGVLSQMTWVQGQQPYWQSIDRNERR